MKQSTVAVRKGHMFEGNLGVVLELSSQDIKDLNSLLVLGGVPEYQEGNFANIYFITKALHVIGKAKVGTAWMYAGKIDGDYSSKLARIDKELGECLLTVTYVDGLVNDPEAKK